MVDTLQYAGKLKEISTLSKEFADGMRRVTEDSFGWGLEHMADSYISIFNRFCPFEVGDRVELLKDVPCEGGWSVCKHFLIRGGKATIHARGYNNEKFSFDVIFDDESWIDDDGEVHPMKTNKHTFGISETYFRKI